MNTILITGGAGFIGSCFIRSYIGEYNIINLDALTYAGNLQNLNTIESCSNYRFVKGSICDRISLETLFREHEIHAVINFAAESHVDRSIEDPEIFLRTNIIGTEALLNVAKSAWKLNPSDKYCRKYKSGVKFIQISTDEVYGELGADGLFTEATPLSPNSPYSASKASADMLTMAYHHTFGLPINITRCSNNYGPYQFPEKLIPLMINNSLNDKLLPVYGDGLQVRDWLHVYDHCHAIKLVLEQGVPGEVYNIGGNNEMTNLEIVRMILKETKKPESLITHIQDRPGHDRRYAIDSSKITTELGWKPTFTLINGLRETIRWYVDNPKWLLRIISKDYLQYYNRYYEQTKEI